MSALLEIGLMIVVIAGGLLYFASIIPPLVYGFPRAIVLAVCRRVRVRLALRYISSSFL